MINNEAVSTTDNTKGMAEFFGKVYGLLALAVLSSAVVSFWVAKTHPHAVYAHPILVAIGFIGSLFLFQATRSISGINLLTLLLFTGMNGLMLGPTIAMYLHATWGPAVLAEAFLTTFVIAISLSAYVFISKKNFSIMGEFLFTGLIAGLVITIVQIFWHPPIFREVLSTILVLLFSGFILYDTSEARTNWEKLNPLDVVISLFLDLDNMFINLLRLMKD